jgi:hypothetical protein
MLGVTSDPSALAGTLITVYAPTEWMGAADAPATTDTEVANGSIVAADILLNDQHFEWTPLLNDSTGLTIVEVVVAHELGHAIGIAHPCPDEELCDAELHGHTTMYALYFGAAQATPATDDIAAICTLYPLGRGTECSGSEHYGELGCGALCDESEVCTSGTCLGGVCVAAECLGCEPAEYCEGETCRPRRQLGDPCGADVQCSSALCHQGRCGAGCVQSCPNGYTCETAAGICTATLGLYGHPCTQGEECTSSLCVIEPEGGACTRPCEDSECVDGARCASVDDRMVCRFSPPSSCAVAHSSQRPHPLFMIPMLAVYRLRKRTRP